MYTDIKVICKATAMVDSLPEDNNIYDNADSVVTSHKFKARGCPINTTTVLNHH